VLYVDREWVLGVAAHDEALKIRAMKSCDSWRRLERSACLADGT
jgi:hypothetical protein